MSRETRRTRRRRASQPAPDLVIVANRLPLEYDEEEGWRRAPGGLVSAMESVLRDREALWVGWSGQFADDDSTSSQHEPPARTGTIELVNIPLTHDQVAGHYDGFSNGALWPNYHGGIVAPVYHRSQFETHREVNRAFADAVADTAAHGVRVWVHDYQLQLLPAMLRARRPDLRIGFFLHIPFPSIEVFSQLPWRAQIIEGLLGADLIGFQTTSGARNFLWAANQFSTAEEVDGALHVDDTGGSRSITVRAFPIGIRATDYADLAARPEVQERSRQIRADVGDPDILLLGVDRLDYTKGIDVRIQAVTELLLDGDLDPERTAFIQVAPPTRAKVEEYQKIRENVELLVSRANGALGPVGTNPIHYMHQPLPPDELAAMYLAADMMLVTPLQDGMNLVAKEYVAARVNGRGALVLSEFTGAAEQMTEAWLVNPYDIEGMKRTILAALREPEVAAIARMSALRAGVFTDDVAKWAEDFLDSLSGAPMMSTEPEAAGEGSAPAPTSGAAGRASEGGTAGPAPSPSSDLRRALDQLEQPQRLLVALDFDGTISPLVPVPSQARPLPGALDQLRRLAEAPGTEVVLVSGRGRDDLVEVSGAADIAVLIGSHGQEIGEDVALDDDESALLASIRDAVDREVAPIPGVRVEDKPAGVAVHVRGCAPADADRALAAAESVAARLHGTRRLEGKLVIELSVRPLDKGTAMRSLIEADPERRVLFAGDDVTDESAMAALRPADVAIKVGAGESLARHRVADPREMLGILEVLAEMRGGPPGPPQDPPA